MALQFVFGGSGSGKSHYLYQRVTKEAGENPALNYIVIVPEQFTMQTQRDLVFMSEHKGIMNVDVLSFGRLAYRVFEETGKGNTPVLDDEGKNLILRKIAVNYESELKVLKGNMKKLGYVSEVKSVLSEFDQYDIGLEKLNLMMEKEGENSFLYHKLKDIRTIYQGFNEYLGDRFITKEEILGILCQAVPESELLKRSVLILDGFTGFTPVQNRLLAELMKHCIDLVITMTIDENENPYVYHSPYQMFGMSKHTVHTLTQIAKECGVEQKRPVWMNERPYYRFRHSDAIQFLEANLFRYKGGRYEEQQDQIVLHEAQNIRGEATAAAATIRKIVRTKGYRYREVALISANMDAYSDDLQRAFESYNIPYFMDHKRSILLNAFVEYVRSVLAMAEQNFSYDSVFRFLRSGYSPIQGMDVDLLDNYCRAHGIRGYKNWQEKWIRRNQGMSEEELTELNGLRVQFVEHVDELVFVLKQRRKTVRDITEALYHYLVKEDVEKKISEQEAYFSEIGELALAKEYGQVYGALIGLFERFVELLGDEPVSMKEYCELIDAGFSEAKIGVIPPGLDQVIVGDLERTRLKDIKALIVVGVNDTNLPGKLRRTGILTERDREKFQKEMISLTPGGNEQAYIQKFYLYQNLTKPENELHVFFSKSDSDGKAMRPAYLVGEIKKLFPKVKLVDEEKRSLIEKEMTGKSALMDLIEGLRMKAEMGGEWMELYNWYKKHPEWADKIMSILDANFIQYRPAKISTEAAKLLYGEDYKTSISRMEKFTGCAFAHFLSYGLRLEEQAEYEFQAMDLGTVFHGAMESYSKQLARQKKLWTDVEEEERKELVKTAVETAVAKSDNSVLYSSARNEFMIERMKYLVDQTVWALTEQLKRGDFVPAGSEYRFENGTIDRLDTCVDGQELYVKIVDYKTGSKEFDLAKLYHGLQLQLIVYMNAAMEEMRKKYPGKEVIPAGVFYYRMSNPLIEKATGQDIQKAMLKEMRLDGMVNLEKESLAHLDRTIQSDSLVVKVSKTKDGIGSRSKAMDALEFHAMLEYAKVKTTELKKQIDEGDVAAAPYRYGSENGCEYCSYRHVCGFDDKLPGYKYRRMKKLDKEEVIAEMINETNRKKGD